MGLDITSEVCNLHMCILKIMLHMITVYVDIGINVCCIHIVYVLQDASVLHSIIEHHDPQL